MGRVKDARPCLNVFAFFGGGTHRLVFGMAAAERREAGGDQSKTVTPGLLSASSQGHGKLLNELLSSSAQQELLGKKLPDFYVGARAHSHSRVPK